jgi:hypothetical protein
MNPKSLVENKTPPNRNRNMADPTGSRKIIDISLSSTRDKVAWT